MTAFLPPDWSPSDTATVVLFVSLLGAAVTALIIGGRYIAGRMRRWDYPEQFTADPADVAERERELQVTITADISGFTEALSRAATSTAEYRLAYERTGRILLETRLCAELDVIAEELADALAMLREQVIAA